MVFTHGTRVRVPDAERIALIAQLEERHTEDLKAACSIHVGFVVGFLE